MSTTITKNWWLTSVCQSASEEDVWTLDIETLTGKLYLFGCDIRTFELSMANCFLKKLKIDHKCGRLVPDLHQNSSLLLPYLSSGSASLAMVLTPTPSPCEDFWPLTLSIQSGLTSSIAAMYSCHGLGGAHVFQGIPCIPVKCKDGKKSENG